MICPSVRKCVPLGLFCDYAPFDGIYIDAIYRTYILTTHANSDIILIIVVLWDRKILKEERRI